MRPSAREFAEFNGLLASVVERGLPLPPAFGLLAGVLRHRGLRDALRAVGAALQDGTALPDALALHPRIFPPDYCGLIRAGAGAGRLAEVLRMAQTQQSLRARLRGKLGRLLLYLACGTIIGELVLLAVVLMGRRLEVVYRAMQIETQMVHLPNDFLGQSLRSGALFMILVPLAVALAAGVYVLVQRWARVGWIGYRLPVWGPIQKSGDLALFCCSAGLRLHSGSPTVEALRAGRDSVSNRRFRRLADQVIRRVGEGEALSTALFYFGFFPKTLAWGISLAEENGELPRAFDTFAGLYTTQMERGFDLLYQFLTPLGILAVGNIALITGLMVVGPLIAINQVL